MNSVLLSILLLSFLLQASISEAANQSRSAIQKIVLADSETVFGKRRGDYQMPNSRIAMTVRELTTLGDSDEVIALGRDIFLMSGCRPQSCDEKGAVIVNMKSRKLLAVGLRHFHCHTVANDEQKTAGSKRATVSCGRDATLTIFMLHGKGRIENDSFDVSFTKMLEQRGEKSYGGKSGYTSSNLKIIKVKRN